MEDYSDCSKYGHNYILLYYRPWRKWFRKVEFHQCINCSYNTKHGKV